MKLPEINFVPAPGRLVVYTPPVERKSEAGLHLETAKSLDASLPVEGYVVANDEFDSHTYTPRYDYGDRVLIQRYTGIKVSFDGDENFLIVDEDRDVLGKIGG